MDEPEHDQSTYWGRFRTFAPVSNPFHAFYSNERIEGFKKLIEDQKLLEEQEKKSKGASKVLISAKRAKELRLAEKVVSTAVNPDSGNFIPWTARMSSFLPLNMPISFGLIIAPP